MYSTASASSTTARRLVINVDPDGPFRVAGALYLGSVVAAPHR
jgi:hypothetical protein